MNLSDLIKSKMLRYAIIAFILSGTTKSAFSQIEYLERNLLQQFVNRGSAKKIKHFNGHLDGFHPILLTIIWDNFQCKGELNYLESDQKFALSGKLENGIFYLSEDNPKGDITGYIKGSIINKHFKGQWTNYNNTLGATVVAKECKSDLYSKKQLDQYWFKVYTNLKTSYPVELIIQHTEAKEIVGSIWIEKEEKTRLLEGSLDEKGNLVCSILNSHGTKWGELVGRLKENNDSKIVLKTGQNLINLRCQLTTKSRIKKLSHAEFSANYVLSYPKLEHTSFNTWMEGLLRKQVADFRKARDKSIPAIPGNRSKDRFSGTTYIEFLTDKIVTGWINIECTDHTFNQTIPFNYHLDLKRNLQIEDIFVEADFISKNKTLIQEAKDVLKEEYPNRAIQNWIDKASFSIISLRHEGIHFSTDFNVIFGKFGFTIPYEKLTSHLNNEAMEAIN